MPNKDANDVPDEIDYSYFWITRDGDVIAYKDMTPQHLFNTYKFLETRFCDFLNKCANRNEEMEPPQWAQDAICALEKEIGRRELLGDETIIKLIEENMEDDNAFDF